MTIDWLCGSRDPRRSAPPPQEHRLLHQVAGERAVLGGNFEWPHTPGAFRPMPLVVASAHNTVCAGDPSADEAVRTQIGALR